MDDLQGLPRLLTRLHSWKQETPRAHLEFLARPRVLSTDNHHEDVAKIDQGDQQYTGRFQMQQLAQALEQQSNTGERRKVTTLCSGIASYIFAVCRYNRRNAFAIEFSVVQYTHNWYKLSGMIRF